MVTKNIWPEAVGGQQAFIINHFIAVTIGELYVVALATAIKLTVDWIYEKDKNEALKAIQLKTESEFLRSISVKPYVIVTTAYREYTAESYDLNVLDYLVKPIPSPRFLKAINKVTQQLYLTKNIVQNVGDQDSFIFLKVEKKLVKVKHVDMLYIQSLKDYIKVYTEEGNYIVHKSLTNILEELPSQKFLRIHRSYIISLEKVKSIEGNSVEIGTVRIPIGRKYISQAKQIILQTEMD
ncbi:LytR/AlgR family response regulator transcription factor [Tenacibaculum maritimum]|uniref:LytR/AlgR family response regulator transcription factor n=1 Tax=Tenacibaculum maritimum TaxID=107401 RepID=UPI00132FA060|nr:LytTR family DNA-binding domain-containing protein [Tenacibaculum maritimum]MCD9582744.1 LytTR family DNA-binding domain-containing protein [Tenacibaculum maritimum]MCD9636883.1 LytTR family DNA-binding domain-containing protein [Tenacibaculum maritimum]